MSNHVPGEVCTDDDNGDNANADNGQSMIV